MNLSPQELLGAARADLERGFTVRAGSRFRQAAESGSVEAEIELIRALVDGRVPGGYAEARRWLERGGDGTPCELLLVRARLRYAGIGGEADPAAALADLVSAAAGGTEEAQVELALAWSEHGNGPALAQAQAWLAAAGRTADYPFDAPAEPIPAPAALPSWAKARDVAPSERLSPDPQIHLFPGLLSAFECTWLRDRAAPLLAPSRVVDPRTGASQANPVRTGFTACLAPGTGGVFDLRLAERMARAAGLDPGCGEPLAVLRYLPGQEYKPHFDWIGPAGLARDALAASGDRVATLLGYLNTPERGGATVFPRLGISVAPLAGTVLAFANVDSAGRPSQQALHAGDPVVAGEKWLASLWIRARACQTATPIRTHRRQ